MYIEIAKTLLDTAKYLLNKDSITDKEVNLALTLTSLAYKEVIFQNLKESPEIYERLDQSLKEEEGEEPLSLTESSFIPLTFLLLAVVEYQLPVSFPVYDLDLCTVDTWEFAWSYPELVLDIEKVRLLWECVSDNLERLLPGMLA